jgi:hypothetical protein
MRAIEHSIAANAWHVSRLAMSVVPECEPEATDGAGDGKDPRELGR